MSIYTNENLVAFLDGELDQEAANKLATALQADPALRSRLDALDIDLDPLKAAFQPMLGVAQTRNLNHRLDCAISHEAANDPKRGGMAVQLLSYVATIAVGIAIGWGFLADETDWRVEVAHYQALYVADTLGVVSPEPEQLAAQFQRASGVLGIELSAETFTNIEGLTLRRAQVLGFEGAPLVQIAFTTAQGMPVAFCIVKQGGDDQSIESDTLVGLASASWSSANHGFLTIGGTDISKVSEWASILKSRI